MFNISDRLKAAVNSIEATGTSLQQRAISQNHAPAQSTSTRSAPSNASKGPAPASPVASSPSTEKPVAAAGSGTATSPTRHSTGYVGSTSALAEGALSGLRKSFNFSRPSLDGQRSGGPSSPRSPSTGNAALGQELKDLPHSPNPSAGPIAGGSRPSSPARFLGATNAFSLGSSSDPSSMAATPRPRSPQPSTGKGSPLTIVLPPDPDDPASYPLPPSPTIPPSPLPTAHSTLYADPLGASPLLPPVEEDIPVLGIQEPTPAKEKKEEEALIANGDDTADALGSPIDEPRKSGESSRSVNGDTTDDAAAQLAKAERRYEGESGEEAHIERGAELMSDLSNRFTTLLTQKHNADKVLRDLTPLEGGIGDHEALEGWVRMMNGKVEMITDEMKRLQGKITLQESRIEELRDTHRLEGSSQSELITKLRSQLSTAETNLAKNTTDGTAVAKLKEDLTKAQTSAKEEEEKRTKAISLLKTVRMKLVKVEKEKEEIEKDRAEERAERSSAKDEVERVKAEKEREVNQLRKGFERELASAKERYEKDLQTKKAAWELEMITTKAAHAREISAKSTKVTGLEAIVKELSVTNNTQFEELQAKQAEAESSRSELESQRNRTKELEFQIREANERNAILEDARPGQRAPSLAPSRAASPSRSSSSPVEVQRLLAEAEARSEAKISDLRNKVHSLEIERNEAEEEWAAKLSERVRELEKLRRVITEKESEFAESQRGRKEKEKYIADAEEARKAVEKEMKMLKAEIEQAKENVKLAAEAERAARDELSGLQAQISTLSGQLDDAKTHTTALKNNNKTLREELRKVQSSVQLMERSRNPGVGYWSSNNPSRPGVTSPGETPTPGSERKSLESVRTGQTSLAGASGVNTPTASQAGDTREKGEEEVNLEYLRNVILQFLENKEMRPNLVRVLSVILRFTPQELRRLNAKISA